MNCVVEVVIINELSFFLNFNDIDLFDGGVVYFVEIVREIKKRYMYFKKKKFYKLCNENL